MTLVASTLSPLNEHSQRYGSDHFHFLLNHFRHANFGPILDAVESFQNCSQTFYFPLAFHKTVQIKLQLLTNCITCSRQQGSVKLSVSNASVPASVHFVDREPRFMCMHNKHCYVHLKTWNGFAAQLSHFGKRKKVLPHFKIDSQPRFDTGCHQPFLDNIKLVCTVTIKKVNV